MGFLKQLASGALVALGALAAGFFFGRKVEKAEGDADAAEELAENTEVRFKAKSKAPKNISQLRKNLREGRESKI